MSRGTAVVTGAARGLGAQLARRLAAKGYDVALVGLEPDLLARVAHECGPRAIALEADVTDGARLRAVAAEVEARLGPADVVVANAGIALGAPLLHADADAFDRVIEVNLLGSVRTARAFAPQLVARRGYLLQVASLAALTPVPMMAGYAASKSGVEAFALALRGELAHHGVGVGVAYLSWTDTDLVRGADEVGPLARQRASLPPPFNRTYPLPEATERLVDGIGRRAARVYAPGWIRVALPLRQLIGASITFGASHAGRRMRATEKALVEQYGQALDRAVGAGGAADTAARREHGA